jgi:hypothetical protein
MIPFSYQASGLLSVYQPPKKGNEKDKPGI